MYKEINSVLWGADIFNKYTLLIVFWFCAVAGSLLWNIQDHKKDIEKVLLDRGRSLYEVILLHRQWNSMHGGVYVPVTEKSRPNPYLLDPLRDLTCNAGLKLTKVNPAFMTREVGKLSQDSNYVQFNITGLKTLRVGNVPDKWETKTLKSFKDGATENFVFIDDEDKGSHYRYMAPLYVNQSCLTCHGKQGYKEGELLGGISVSFDADEVVFVSSNHVFHMIEVHGVALLFGLLLISGLAHYSIKADRKVEGERARFRDLVQLTNAIHWEVDIATMKFTYISPNVEDLLGYPATDWKDFDFWANVLHPEDREWATNYCKDHIAISDDHIFTYRVISADGREVWIRDIVSVVADANGNPVKLQGLFIDDTQLKSAESNLKISLNEKTVLLKEVHHRVKNNMAVIMSLQSLQLGRIDDGPAKEVLTNNMQRIRSMALVHEMIYQSDDLASIDAAEYLNRMSSYISSIYSFPRAAVDIEVEFDQSCQDLDNLIPMGIIVNELLSNAMKHAFENYEGAHISMSLKCTDDGQAELIVKDNGKELPEDELIKDSASLGFKLVYALVDQIDGSLEIKRDKGTAFHIKYDSKRKS